MSTVAPTQPRVLPAPIGIPAGRARAPSCTRPPLASSPTHTPFSVTPLGTPVSAARAYSPPPHSSIITIPTTGSSPKTLPPSSPILSSSPPSPKVATPSSPVSPSSPKDKEKKKLHKPWARMGALFDMDSMLGALDPNRMAVASAPEPIKACIFGAETETGLAVCRALLHARNYTITALMVDDKTPATEELLAQGVKVVQVDMDSPVSYARYLAGSKAVYLSSNGEWQEASAISLHRPSPFCSVTGAEPLQSLRSTPSSNTSTSPSALKSHAPRTAAN